MLDGVDAPERARRPAVLVAARREGPSPDPQAAPRGADLRAWAGGAARRARPRGRSGCSSPRAPPARSGASRRRCATSRTRSRCSRRASARGSAPARAILATVSPQHLYGLLFRVLWPLAAGRPFLRSAVLHPEELAPYIRTARAVRGRDDARHAAPAGERSELVAARARCRAVFSSGGPLDGRGRAARRGRARQRAVRDLRLHRDRRRRGAPAAATGDEPWQPMPGVARGDRSRRRAPRGPLALRELRRAGGRGTRALRHRRSRRALAAGRRLPAARARRPRGQDRREAALAARHGERGCAQHPAVAGRGAACCWTTGRASRASRRSWCRAAAGLRRDATRAGAARSARTLSEHLAARLRARAAAARLALRRRAAAQRAGQDCRRSALRALFADATDARPSVLSRRARGGASLEHRVRVPRDLAHLDGHFPGQPVVAGVVQLHFAMRALEELLGERPRSSALEALKFHEVLLPAQEALLRVELDEDGARFRFSLADPDERDARRSRAAAAAWRRCHEAVRADPDLRPRRHGRAGGRRSSRRPGCPA